MSFWIKRIIEQSVARLEQYSMPVGYLKKVLHEYSFGYTRGVDHVNPLFNTFNLQPSTLDNLKAIKIGGTAIVVGESSSIQTLYHEAVHAYLDLKSETPIVARLVREGSDYYHNAPLLGGEIASNGYRLFHEAIASYVGHRAATWYGTFDDIERYRELVAKRTWEGASNDWFDRVEALIRKIPNEYNREMNEKKFGYEYRGWIGFRRQVSTTKDISSAIKSYCDSELLEFRIPNSFNHSHFLKQKYDSLIKFLNDSRHIVPVELVGH